MLSVLQIIQHRSGIYCFSPTYLMEANNSQIITQSSTTGSTKILLHQSNQVQIKGKKKKALPTKLLSYMTNDDHAKRICKIKIHVTPETC